MSLLTKITGKFRSASKKTSRPAFKPTLEGLEERKVMSASSMNIHAVTQANGSSAVFFINEQNHSFYEHNSTGTHFLSGATTVQSFTAGVDRSGNADAFVIAGDKSVWEYNTSGWHKLNEPTKMIELAAVKGDRAYAVSADHALWEYSKPSFGFGSTWHKLSASNTVSKIDAVTDSTGRDAVFALMNTGTLDEVYQGNWAILSKANFFHSDISAGLDLQGHADVFGRSLGNDQLWRHTNAAGWQALGTPGLTSQISATTGGQVAFIDSSTKLQKFDAQGTIHLLDGVSSYNEISAAADNDVFVVIWNKSLWERFQGNWSQLSGPGTVQ